jgi:endonuclease/exonuclease/phosphatase (EEP) superfamily protein YafD
MSGARATSLDRAAFLLGVLCLGATVAAQGGRVSEGLDLLTHFAPCWLAGGLAVALYGVLFAKRGRRAAPVVLGLLSAAAAVPLMLPEYARPIPRFAQAKRTVKLIQLNAWDKNLDAGSASGWIARVKPDIVVVEEAEPPIRAALLARGFVLSPGFGHVAIFSRAAPVGRPAPLSAAEWREMPPFARATFGARAAAYTVLAAHLPEPTEGYALLARRMLATLASRYDRAHLIVAGDFNLTPWSFALRGLDRALGLQRVDRAAYSWPARVAFGGLRVTAIPFLPIDHVYAGSAWRLVSLTREPAPGSDHDALEVVLSETD